MSCNYCAGVHHNNPRPARALEAGDPPSGTECTAAAVPTGDIQATRAEPTADPRHPVVLLLGARLPGAVAAARVPILGVVLRVAGLVIVQVLVALRLRGLFLLPLGQVVAHDCQALCLSLL